MTKRPLEDLIIEYVEDALSPEEKISFEHSLSTDPHLAALVEGYRFSINLESAIRCEEYPPSPGFTQKVMGKIEGEKRSIFNQFRELFSAYSKPLATIAIVLLVVVTTTRPRAPIPNPSSSADTPPRETASFIPQEISPLYLDSSAAFETREDQRGLRGLLNSLDTPFPPGPDRPIALSIEAIQSQSDSATVLVAISVTYLPLEDTPATRPSTLSISIEGKSKEIVVLAPWDAPSDVGRNPTGPVVIAKGSTMTPGQQFTSLVRLRLREMPPPHSPLAKILVTYSRGESLKTDHVELMLGSDQIAPESSTISYGMKRVLDILSPSKKF